MWIFLIIYFLTLILLVYLLFKISYYRYWSKRGVLGPKPTFPFGNILTRLLKPSKVFELEWAKQYGKFYGIYYGWKPALSITDADLIKQVLIKDFPMFVNRRKLNVFHEIWSRNLFQEQGEQWRRVRSIMSPAFTSKKLRSMYQLMNRCIDRLDNYLDFICPKPESLKKSTNFDAKKVFVGLTIDVIASTSFATEINVNHLSPSQSDSKFIKYGLSLFEMPFFRVLAYWTFPRIINDMINFNHSFNPTHLDFFIDLAKHIIEERKRINVLKTNKTKYDDLVQLLIDTYAYEHDLDGNNYDHLTATMDNNDPHQDPNYDLQKKSRNYLTEKEIVAQCVLFFVAGFETTATTLTFTFYELAMNPSVQEKLYNELSKFHFKNKSIIFEDYCEKLMNEVPYLDAVIKETLRKYPPLVRLERRVSVDGFKLNGIPLDKDTVIEIPTLAVHYCADYFPDPERYYPERFMPENKHLINSYAYIPFGLGPRNCIGMRFAYQELKLTISRMVLKYRFSPNDQTPKIISFPKAAMLNILTKLPLAIEKR